MAHVPIPSHWGLVSTHEFGGDTNIQSSAVMKNECYLKLFSILHSIEVLIALCPLKRITFEIYKSDYDALLIL